MGSVGHFCCSLFLFGSMLFWCLPITTGQTQDSDQAASIDRWIQQLAADTYADRANAERQLQGFGSAAVAQLAHAVLTNDIETSASCLRILKNVRVTEDDATTFKTALIIQKLATAGYVDLSQKSQEIVSDWKVAKVKSNVRRLEQAGAVVQVFHMEHLDHGVFGHVYSQASPVNQSDLGNSATIDQLDVTSALIEIERLNQATNEQLQSEFADQLAKPESRNRSLSGTVQIIEGGLRLRAGGEFDVVVVPDLVVSRNQTSSLHIQSIELNDKWKGTPENYELLRMLPAVTSIAIRGLQIDQVLLENLTTVPGLQMVTMSDSQFDLGQILDFMRKQPQIQISVEAKSFLGVQAPLDYQQTNQQCLIDAVVPGSSAAKAGLIKGDIITQLGDTSIGSFAELRLVVSLLDPGVTLPIMVQRGGESLELTVTLGGPSDRGIIIE